MTDFNTLSNGYAGRAALRIVGRGAMYVLACVGIFGMTGCTDNEVILPGERIGAQHHRAERVADDMVRTVAREEIAAHAVAPGRQPEPVAVEGDGHRRFLGSDGGHPGLVPDRHHPPVTAEVGRHLGYGLEGDRGDCGRLGPQRRGGGDNACDQEGRHRSGHGVSPVGGFRICFRRNLPQGEIEYHPEKALS